MVKSFLALDVDSAQQNTQEVMGLVFGTNNFFYFLWLYVVLWKLTVEYTHIVIQMMKGLHPKLSIYTYSDDVYFLKLNYLSRAENYGVRFKFRRFSGVIYCFILAHRIAC